MTLFADILLIIIIFAGFLYAINKDDKNKGNHKDNKDEVEDEVENEDEDEDEVDEVEDEVKDEDDVENEDENEDDKDEDNKDAEDEQFKSEWYAIIKERIEYENKISKLDCNCINWAKISKSSNSIAIKLMQEYPEKIVWDRLCTNEHPYAIDLLKKNTNKIMWHPICMNKNPDVIPLIKERIEIEKNLITRDSYQYVSNRINWEVLINNENARELIMDRIEYEKTIMVKENWMPNITRREKGRLQGILFDKIMEKDINSLIIFNQVSDLDVFQWSRLIDTVITHL
jgi:hypothetical protein